MAMFDVIAYEGGNDVLVYKYPHTEFNTLSQLEVHESQEAIFFRDGKMLDSFGPGRYTLHSGNIPLLSKLVNLPFGGESPFRCEVYFVNKALALNYKWGTQSQTRVMDKQFNLILHIGANGTLGLKVVNPRMLLSKVVGSESMLTAEVCFNYFRENVSAQVKQYLARVMSKPEMNFLLLEMYLTDFAAAVKGQLNSVFQDVGVELYNFVFGGIHISEEEYAVIQDGQKELARAQYEKKLKVLAAQGDAESIKILADANAMARKLQGYNWADEQVAEITKIYAANAGNGANPANMLAQAPMAMAFGNMLRNNMEPLMGMQFSNPPMNFGQQGTTPPQPANGVPGGVVDIGGGTYADVTPDLNFNPADVSPIPNGGQPAGPGTEMPPEPMQALPVTNSSVDSDTKEKRKAEIRAKLKEFKELFEEKLIDESEYKEARKELIDELTGM